MSELRLDYQKNRPFPWAGACMLGLVSIVLIILAIYFFNLRNQVTAMEASIERASMKEPQHTAVNPSSGIGKVDLALEIKNANDVLHRLSVPWEELFNAVESSSGSHVTLLALEPDFDKKQVKISGEANSYKTIMNYITKLQDHDVLGSVYLQNHDVKQDDPDNPVRFSIVANWREKP
jgi:hypothetical protein